MTSGSDRKSTVTGVSWLHGLLAAKRWKAWMERLPVSPTLPTVKSKWEVSGPTKAQFFGSKHVHDICAVCLHVK